MKNEPTHHLGKAFIRPRLDATSFTVFVFTRQFFFCMGTLFPLISTTRVYLNLNYFGVKIIGGSHFFQSKENESFTITKRRLV